MASPRDIIINTRQRLEEALRAALDTSSPRDEAHLVREVQGAIQALGVASQGLCEVCGERAAKTQGQCGPCWAVRSPILGETPPIRVAGICGQAESCSCGRCPVGETPEHGACRCATRGGCRHG